MQNCTPETHDQQPQIDGITPYFPPDPENYAPWVSMYGLFAEYGKCQCGCGQPVKTAPFNAHVRGQAKGCPIRFVDPHQNTFNGRRYNHVERFWQRVAIAGPDDCWLWQGHVIHTGYGQAWDGVKKISAHRYAFEIANGPIPGDLLIAHRCDVRRCCNPAHLFAATQKENIADMFSKGRQNRANGERHGNAVLTNEDAREYRRQFALMNVTVAEFARMHNVYDETMRRLLKGETYRNA